jgi:two-component system, probable response regulator PhcQ
MPHKILLVDDEPDVLDVIKNFVQMEDYEALTASSAEEGLKILAEDAVDVVISDEQMPGISGTVFLGIVRQQFPDTVRILLTGHADLETAIRAINDGEIYRFFTKPCNFTELMVTLKRGIMQNEMMLETRRLLQAYRRQTTMLKQVEKKFPGATKLDKTQTGSIILDSGSGDFDTLYKEVKAEVSKAEGQL